MANSGFLGVGWSYPGGVDGGGNVSIETQHEEFTNILGEHRGESDRKVLFFG